MDTPQTPQKKRRFSLKYRNSFFYDLYLVVAVVMIWRGVWSLLDYYFFPGSPVLSSALGLGIGILLLYLPDEDFTVVHGKRNE